MDVETLLARVRPRRKIRGISAVFMPFHEDGRPDLDAFASHLARTAQAGLEPAVNMDTGFGPELGPRGRAEVLRVTHGVVGAQFVAGAMPFGEDGDPIAAYRRGVGEIVGLGGTPIVFPSDALTVDAHPEIVRDAPRALAFELGAMFAPFGRIYDDDGVRRLMDVPQLIGLKHSSLDRRVELQRLALRDRHRPEFHIFTGNDLAIDMVCYGSDYLLGLSTFDPEAFAHRDALWLQGDPRFYTLNDALQAVGRFAFRDPVPAYKSSAAAYLALTGRIPAARPHPSASPRPEWEADALAPLADAVARVMS